MTTIPTTGMVTLNAAFLQEIKEVNQELWCLLSRLRHAFSRPISLRSEGRELLGCLQAFRDNLAMHFALEEAYGYFENPVDAAPRLCDQAARLRDEHGELYLAACRLADEAESLLAGRELASLATKLANDFRSMDEQFSRHESEENALIVSIYSDDIGVGD